MTLEELLSRFDRVEGNGRGRKVNCPTHADDKASLSIREGDDGKLLLHCFAGCNTKAVMLALGLSLKDLAGDRGVGGSELARYPYQDENGGVLYERVRYEPKDFRISPTGYRGPRVPYRLPDLLASAPRRILWVEGEKDADRLRELGFVATTAGSATDWRAEMARWFEGRSVTIVPDNDDPGRAHAQTVAFGISQVARDVMVWNPPDVPLKGDVSDWLDAGHNADDLRAALKHARPFVNSAIQLFADLPTETVDWLWFPRIALGAITIVFGEAGLGKSTVMLDIVARLSRGDAMPNGVERAQLRKTIITGIEGPVSRTRDVLAACGADMGNVAFVRTDRLPDPNLMPLEQLDYLGAEMKKMGATVLLVDNISDALLSDTDSNNEYSVRRAMRRISDFAEGNGFSVVLISHPKKNASFGLVKEAITGSQAFTNLPRTTLFVAPVFEGGERTGACALAVAKTNLYDAEQINTLSFELTSHEVGYRDGQAIMSVPTVSWQGVIYKGAQELLDDMRPVKDHERSTTEPPSVTGARHWFEAFLPTMPRTGMSWSEIVDAAASSIASGVTTHRAMRRVRDDYLRGAGQAGRVLWFPPDAEIAGSPGATDSTPAPEVGGPGSSPGESARERMEKFAEAEPLEQFLRRMEDGGTGKPPDGDEEAAIAELPASVHPGRVGA